MKYEEWVRYRGRDYQYIGKLGSNMMGETLCVIRSPKTGRLIGPMPVSWLTTGDYESPRGSNGRNRNS